MTAPQPNTTMAASVKARHGGVTVRREPIGSDPAAEVPRDQWGELLAARRAFCEQVVPGDCRNLLFFVQDAAANDWLGLDGREEYIRALKLEPQMVDWALEGLKATRPDMAVKFEDAVKLGSAKHAGPGRGKKTSRDTRGLGESDTAAYIRGRLERDGHTDLLARVERGEVSAHAAAVALGWRTRMVQVAPTVEGFTRAIQKHLSPKKQDEFWKGHKR
jgi:hypothetical protein